jgi:hypothetical protein
MRVQDHLDRDLTPRIRKSRATLALLAMAAPKPLLRDHFGSLL